MKNDQQTLVILTPGFPKDQADSTCLPAQQNFVKAVNKNFPAIKIIIVTFQYPFIQTTYEWHGNEVIAIGGKNKGKLHRLVVWIKAWNRLKKIRKENKVTGLLSFWCGECAFIGSRFGAKFKLQHICWLLGQDVKAGNKFMYRMKVHAENFIALSDFISNEFYKNYAIKPANTIPLGIDVNEFSASEQSRDIDILAAGSLIPLKQYEIFIAVIAKLKNDFPAIKAVLCGWGTEKNKLQHLVTSLSLEQNIVLAGEKPHREVLSIMQRSKIFLHPSAYEGFGMVCTEALYAGCRVVSFVQPMKATITNWHIVKDEMEMVKQCAALLNDTDSGYYSVMPYNIDDTAAAVVQLFTRK